MKESTKSLIYNILILIFTLTFFIIFLINVINYGDVKRSKSDDNLGLSRTTVEVLFWLNIIVVCVLGYIMLYTLFKILLRPELSFKKVMKLMYRDKAKTDYDMAISVGKNPIEGIQVATAVATSEARKLGKSLSESIKIGTVAGTQSGVLSGLDKGDAKVISKFAAENIIRNELMRYQTKS